MKKRLRIAASLRVVMTLICAITLLVLLNFNWNLARPWINARTSEALGRPFIIAGDLSLSWEKQPSIGQNQGWSVSIALVVLAPIAALMPLIKTGPGENSECARLLKIARIKPVSPPPGKTYPVRPGT